MAPYRSPQVGERVFTKFVRVREEIFVGDNMHVNHREIVEIDRLGEAIGALRTIDPKQLDAGIVDIRGEELNPWENSESLNLPVADVWNEARQITRETFAAQSPNHTVIGLERR